MKRAFPLISLFVAMLMAAGLAHAQQNASREQEQLRRLRAQAQQLQQQQQQVQQQLTAEQQARQAAESERARLGAESETLATEARAARSAATVAQRRIAQLEADLDAERSARAQLAVKLEGSASALAQRDRELAASRGLAAERQRELESARNEGRSLGDRLAQCSKDNVALYRTGIEVLDHYRNRTLGERIGQSEPFLQTGRVRLENLIENWRDRLDEKLTLGATGQNP